MLHLENNEYLFYHVKIKLTIYKIINLFCQSPKIMSKKIVSNLSRYPPSLFLSKNVNEAFYIANKTKFASIMLTNQPDMDVLFAPFFNLHHHNNEKVHLAHLFINNPLFEYLKQKKEAPCRLVFQEADMYISPTVYQEKKTTHKVVPTWNYVCVQFKGVISFTHENNLRQLLQKQVEMFQSQVNSKWRLSDAPNDYVDGLMKTIFGVKVNVTDWKVHKKLSQNKSQIQINNTKKWCEEQGKKQKTIVDWMNYFEQNKNST